MEMLRGNTSIKKIFQNNDTWVNYHINHAPDLNWGTRWNIDKMLRCKTGCGKSTYGCINCNIYRDIPYTCKSRFCSSCGKAHADNWSNEILSDILEVEYKHLFFTVPLEFRSWFKINAKTMSEILFTAVRTSLLEYSSKRGFTPGIIMVLHTFGAAINWNPHVHIIITSGGLSEDESKWMHERVIPHLVIKPMYKYRFLTLMAEKFNAGELTSPAEYSAIKTSTTMNSWLTQFHRKKWFVGLGKSLKESDTPINYVARYTRRPVIAEYRILSADNNNVTFEYHDKALNKKQTLTYDTMKFIEELIQHIPNRNMRIIRNCGIFANRVRTKKLTISRLVLNQKLPPKKLKLRWRESIIATFGIDPLCCPKCGKPMMLMDKLFINTSKIKQQLYNHHMSVLDYFYDIKTSPYANS